MARAKSEGKRFGRPPSLNKEQQQEVCLRIKNGESISSIARVFNTTRQTVMRVRTANALI
ncbi:helix-turn-helix domain-containing protein [Vibrio parahaemolyticus]|uniref:helix-turn-helix domain-containing protein n=1 Tax=Vibrio parahaemolyticus TaxID=670 RepID=UPI0022B304F6|nr:helix-turn-helix domain-containing protein [Vibrio parahaemolyticus]MCZ5880793.1 helix-turn-helix domain-containing protein [Vibrio parahaemolyticus]MCZ6372440.1 helix-turn-helix domain-containing protein [Vibrio parahaemolyticus]